MLLVGDHAMTKRALLGATMLAGIAGAAAVATVPSSSRAQTPASGDAQVREVVVTGSRIPRSEFTSASPVQVLSIERAEVRGVIDTVQLLQSSTLAVGSPQVNPTISSAFVTDGGPGAATVSLRGLGANRTLVLVNGRRTGPAGTRGGVSSVDLNVIPESALESVEILKDGASSVYGSDAIAGVVNLITKRNPDGGELSAFYSSPFAGGGDQVNFTGSWGKTFDRGSFNITVDYYKQYEQKRGDRSYTQCAAQYLFDPATGKRSDRIDPRTGKPACLDSLWGHVWVYGDDFSSRQGRFQFDYDGNLGQFIPPIPAGEVGNYPGFPSGFFLVGQDNPSISVMNGNHPFEDAQSLVPQLDRTTIFLEGRYELTSDVTAYAEVLLNRRESRQTGYRQFWTYNFTSDFFDYFYGPGSGGDPFSVGFTGPYFLSPTPVTDFAGASQKVDYARFVGGLRGSVPGTSDWKWDLFAQYSRSDGDYTDQQILQDAIDTQSFRTGSCVGTTTPISGRPCIDINFADPRVLRGDLTDAERAFLFDTETGNTLYTQTYVEGTAHGNLFDLPAGPLGAAVGFHYREDSINDVPGPLTLDGNAWGASTAGITKGTDTTGELFGELSVPILKDLPFVYRLNGSASGRWTWVQTSGSAGTYKVGLDWAVTPEYKFRVTQGTSFRAPALFELYLAEQTSFPSQRQVDPCINWGFNLADGTITQRLADRCADPAGPGGGVPADHTGSGTSPTLIERGGLGRLKPETSKAFSLGFVWTPRFANLSVAVDYFNIKIADEVTSLGANLPKACYNSDHFPLDPVCALFVRNPGTHRIDTINSDFINISQQVNRGIDLTIRYDKELPWNIGALTVDGQFTWQLKDTKALFEGFVENPNGLIGDPQFVGNLNLQLAHGPWTGSWGIDMIGHQSNYDHFGSHTVTFLGVTHDVRAQADFATFHSLSIKRDIDTWSMLAGVANVFDKGPPQVTTVGSGLGEYDTVGTSVLSSQYTQAYYGRRVFVRATKRF
jgi:iron complex outermembrane receptor protein